MAHGKDAIYSESFIVTREEAEKLRREAPLSPHEKFTTLENAKRAKLNIEEIYKITFQELFSEEIDLSFHGAWSGSITVVE